MAAPSVPSNSQVHKAGKTLRAFLNTGDDDPSYDELWHAAADALDTLVDWRAAHAVPLQSATMGLRSRVATAKCVDVRNVSQRLKRIPTILDKLSREPTMNLSRMADIGGCRAVLRDVDEIRSVQKRYEGSGKVVKIRDYIEYPKESGYRAVHIIVDYSDRKIEVQLRTQVMHEWAYTVEQFTTRIGQDVKSGRGPKPVQDWFQAVSEAMAIEEKGLTVNAILTTRISTLREEAMPYLRGGQR
ncbi:RelA/SpoT domain-containing protein [Rhodococcus erythropolis]